MTVDYDRKVQHDEITADWQANMVNKGVMSWSDIRENYTKLYSDFKSIGLVKHVQTMTALYSDEKKVMVTIFENIPGIETNTVVEVHNVIDETDAFQKHLYFITMILIELQKVTPKRTIEELIEQNKGAIQWAKQYAVQK
ncbi:hypothetical protein UFOVP451_29 [uncultured Caudovirales phage]|uniref:Uncharacterized protein n=1 Tax=uncultured Caudovirales phage TaxID=2100421 RepID=A0A6J5MB35_9CAUD|nr:hypothetical protein UFOVP451_29 [uncultured Caudovirales phage]